MMQHDHSQPSATPVPGTYRHFKGQLYQVIGTATHSETLETLVVYVPLYGEGKLWVRPLASFMEMVVVAGQEAPRFERVVDSGQ